MAIFLVQHGISAPGETDSQKILTQKGEEQTRLIAGVAKNYGIFPEKFIHSGKTRAAQTAGIFHESLNKNAAMEAWQGLGPMDDVRAFAEKLTPELHLMAVGHLPFMERLISFLTAGTENIRVFKCQNSGIICLDAEPSEDGGQDWFVKWSLSPMIT